MAVGIGSVFQHKTTGVCDDKRTVKAVPSSWMGNNTIIPLTYRVRLFQALSKAAERRLNFTTKMAPYWEAEQAFQHKLAQDREKNLKLKAHQGI